MPTKNQTPPKDVWLLIGLTEENIKENKKLDILERQANKIRRAGKTYGPDFSKKLRKTQENCVDLLFSGKWLIGIFHSKEEAIETIKNYQYGLSCGGIYPTLVLERKPYGLRIFNPNPSPKIWFQLKWKSKGNYVFRPIKTPQGLKYTISFA